MEKELTYTQAYEELQSIVNEMEHAEVSIDELDARLKRATDLLKICREKLFKTEKNVQDILDNMEALPSK